MDRGGAPPPCRQRPPVCALTTLRSFGARLLHGSVGVTGAMLMPKAISASAQWLLVAFAGTAALAPFVTITQRGSTAATVISVALAPVIGRRRGALQGESGRHLIGGAMLLLTGLAFVLTLAFEASFGIGVRVGVFSSAFAAATVMAGPALIMWPILQTRLRYVHALLISALPFALCIVFATMGWSQGAAVLMAVGAAIPTAWLLGGFSLIRACRYALGLIRRCVPLSAVTFFTAMVVPMALSRGDVLVGPGVVGRQALFWSLISPLGIASQAIAARLMVREPDRAVRKWFPAALGLSVASLAIFVACRYSARGTGDPAIAIPTAMAVLGPCFLFSDPMCFFFCSPERHRTVAIGSFVCGVLTALALVAWPRMLLRISVYGPSGMIFIGRMFFLGERKLRFTAYSIAITLGLLYCCAVLADISVPSHVFPGAP